MDGEKSRINISWKSTVDVGNCIQDVGSDEKEKCFCDTIIEIDRYVLFDTIGDKTTQQLLAHFVIPGTNPIGESLKCRYLW